MKYSALLPFINTDGGRKNRNILEKLGVEAGGHRHDMTQPEMFQQFIYWKYKVLNRIVIVVDNNNSTTIIYYY